MTEMRRGRRPDTNHTCPECDYRWTETCDFIHHACPKCKYVWEGDCKTGELREQDELFAGDAYAARSPGPDGATSAEIAPLSPSLTTPPAPPTNPTDPPAPQVENVSDDAEIVWAFPNAAERKAAPSLDDPLPSVLTKDHGGSGLRVKGRDYSPMHEVAAEALEEEQPLVSESFDFGFDKPPYRIPLMSELRELPRNGLTVVSTFSGCGGSSLGFRWAGFTGLWASEFVPAAQETYRANFPDTPLGTTDVREVKGNLLLTELGLARGELDVLEGSPPCASFSMAGKRDAAWGEVKVYSDTKQRTDDLLKEYARLLDELQPRAFVMENVPGLVGGKATGYLDEIMGKFHDAGYDAWYRVLDAQWFGVPQRRRRAIFVGFRRDLGVTVPQSDWFPSGLPYNYSIKDALPHLAGSRLDEPGHGYFGGRETSVDEPMIPVRPGDSTGGAQAWQVSIVVDQKSSSFNEKDYVTPSLDDPILTVTKTGISGDDMYDWRLVETPIAPTPEELEETSIEKYAIGREWETLKQGEQSDKYLNLVRPDEDKPVPTVTQTGGVLGAASVTHPSEPRKFTIAELRRLCAFPDDFVLTGTYRQQWERLGRAVPPPLMRAVAERVAQILKELS